jgi:hypothetical protein
MEDKNEPPHAADPGGAMSTVKLRAVDERLGHNIWKKRSSSQIPDHAGSEPKAGARVLTSAERSAVAAFGKSWSLANRELLDSLAVGTVVAVSFPDGAYVAAATGLVAMDAFEERFGHDALAWVFEVGVPISIGGGLWALSSGA